MPHLVKRGEKGESMKKSTVLGIAMVAWGATAQAQSVELCKNPQNILAERLAGTWVVDEAVDSRLNKNRDQIAALGQVQYVEDDTAVEFFDIPESKIPCAFSAGFMTYKISQKGKVETFESPYIVISHNGNPAIVYDEDGKNDGTQQVTDPQVGYMMMAKADEATNDILFVGGDFNNQSLMALRRKK